MSKMLCLGMPMVDVVRAATEAPARAVGHPEPRHASRSDRRAIAVLIETLDGSFDYLDTVG